MISENKKMRRRVRPLTSAVRRLNAEKSEESKGAELAYFERIPAGAGAEFVYDVRTLLFRDASLNYTYLRHTLRNSWAKHSVAMFIICQQSFLSIGQQRYWSAVMEPDEVS